MIIYLPFLVYILAKGDAKELGRDAYWCGLLVTLAQVASHIIGSMAK